MNRWVWMAMIFLTPFILFQPGCTGSSNPPTTSSSQNPTPTAVFSPTQTQTPLPTITVMETLSLVDTRFNASGDDCEAQFLFMYFTNYGPAPSVMIAPCTLQFSGYLGTYSPSLFPQAVSLVDYTNCASGAAPGQMPAVALPNMPATLGESLTWTSSFVVPAVDQTQAASNGLPANIYTDTTDFPVPLVWVQRANASYQFAGSSSSYGFASTVVTSAPISNLADLQSPQTLILNIPVTVP